MSVSGSNSPLWFRGGPVSQQPSPSIRIHAQLCRFASYAREKARRRIRFKAELFAKAFLHDADRDLARIRW